MYRPVLLLVVLALLAHACSSGTASLGDVAAGADASSPDVARDLSPADTPVDPLPDVVGPDALADVLVPDVAPDLVAGIDAVGIELGGDLLGPDAALDAGPDAAVDVPPPPVCDDGDPCTADRVSAAGTCAHLPVVGPCDDGDPCTFGETCAAGACVGTPRTCDDGSECTADHCDPTTGACVAVARDCDDGVACTLDRCEDESGACVHAGDDALCAGAGPCAEAACLPGEGCVLRPIEGACDDGDSCTRDDACRDGVCVGAPGADCDDGDPCTADTCDAGGACVHEPAVDGTECHYGRALGACRAGVCEVPCDTPYDCDDGVDCTADWCASSQHVCRFVPDDGVCDDGRACNGAEVCDITRGCVAGGALDCDDGIACTVDVCTLTGCIHTPSDALCGGVSGCVLDACVAGEGCVATAAVGAACDDADPCTTADACGASGECGGVPLDCGPPSGPCSVRACDAATGTCLETPRESGAACDDGDACTHDDSCDATGACLGAAVTCAPSDDPCLVRACSATTGECEERPGEDGVACDDATACTSDDACRAGVCVGTPQATACTEAGPCMAATCVPGEGCRYPVVEGRACDDADPCTLADRCDADGLCAGTPNACDDGVACTRDACGADGTCGHEVDDAACDDANPCTAERCDATADCLRAGTYATAPTVDGDLGDWGADSLVATNAVPSDLAGARLAALSVQVGPDALYLGIEGGVADAEAWVVLLDVDLGAGTGLTNLSQLGGTSPLDTAVDVALPIAAPGFGADVLVGGIGTASVSGTAASVGCRGLANLAAPDRRSCTVRVDAAAQTIEVAIPWASLLGAPPPAGETLVLGLVALAVTTTGDGVVSNQFLPGQALPLETVAWLPLSGGECLAPSCGNGRTEPGEECDDGNDDPRDSCAGCLFPAEPPDGMVLVPAGWFTMGEVSTNIPADSWSPPHRVWLDAYFLDTYETTNEELAAFLEANGREYHTDGTLLYECSNQHARIDCRPGGRFTPLAFPGYEDHPAGGVTWRGAYEYCRAQGKRLATEAEWEKAARGPRGDRFYPWGPTFDATRLDCSEAVCADGFDETAPIGSFVSGMSFYGVHDMAGNVWEWVSDWYLADYYATSPVRNPEGPCAGEVVACPEAPDHTARGGSWDDDHEYTRSTYRYKTSPGCISDIGVRCARDVTP